VAYTPNANRAVRGGKAVVSAKELADFKAQYGAEKDLTDLLNMDKGLQRQIPRSTVKAVRDKIDSEQSSAPATRSAAQAPARDPRDLEQNLYVSRGARPAKFRETQAAKPGTEVNDENKETSDMSFKRGGMTASRRADGIAQRGKTRGKMY
jgi:cell division septation protein DedD